MHDDDDDDDDADDDPNGSVRMEFAPTTPVTILKKHIVIILYETFPGT